VRNKLKVNGATRPVTVLGYIHLHYVILGGSIHQKHYVSVLLDASAVAQIAE
jgi:hypothetical protein